MVKSITGMKNLKIGNKQKFKYTMARYNSVNTTISIAGGSTITTPNSGLLTTLTGSGTVTIPNPILYTGQTQTFYNSTGSAITLTSPSGNFVGAGASGNGNLTLPASSIVTVVSDGANYIVQSWLGGTITVGGTLTANGAVSMNPTGLNVSIQPTGAGVLTLSSGSTGSIDNVNIGSTTAGNAKFGTLEASGITKVTASTAATTYQDGALIVSGGVGIAGKVFTNESIKAGSASSTNGSIILQGNYSNGAITTFGSEYSSGGPVIGYGVTPSTSASGAFFSSTGLALNRSAYTMQGQLHTWYTGASQTVAIGSSVALSTAMSLSTTALTIGNAANVVVQNTTASSANSQQPPGYIQLTGFGWNTISGSTQYQGQIGLGGTYSSGTGSVEPAFTFSLAGTGNSGYNASAGPNTLTERVRIDNYGRIGVGTTTPLVALDISARTDAIALPKGTTAQRPTGAAGYFRFNTDTTSVEYYSGTVWASLGALDGSTEAKAAPSASYLKNTALITTNGIYWIKTANMTYAAQVYCDFTYDGGGWMLLSYSYVATTGDSASNFAMPNLNHDQPLGTSYTYTPTSRASTNGLVGNAYAVKTALLLAKSSTQMIFAAGNNPSTGGIDNYSNIYRIDIPSPSSLTFNNHAYGYGGASMGVSTVTVTGLKGETGTYTRYTFTEAIGATWSDTYPTGYGLGSNSSVRGWNGDGGPFFPSVHSGSRSGYAGGGFAAQPDVGVNGYVSGSRTYTYRGWYGVSSVNNTGQTSIWVR